MLGSKTFVLLFIEKKKTKYQSVMADIKQYVKSAEEKMSFAIDYLDEQLAHIRAGKA